MKLVSVPEVAPCVVTVEQLPEGGWQRWCHTCHEERPDWLNGPHVHVTATEHDARMSERDHVRAKYRVRQYRAWRAEWSRLVRDCHDWDTFVRLMDERADMHRSYVGANWPKTDLSRVEPERREGLMRSIREIEGGA